MKPDDFTYRSATIKDVDELVQLSIDSYSPYITLLSAEHANKLAHVIKDKENILALLDRAKCFICIHQNKIIGMAFLVKSGQPHDFYEAIWAQIRMVGVHPDYQGMGIAKKLTQMCITHAKDTGEKTIALHTSEFMDAARHIYESLGFKREKELEKRFGKIYWLYLLHI
ncbi:MAG TPA: GNAT family N-acetyltransferase [Bacteroidia bacterium]|jgi:ribosomal protein S18 acetylase RimI-like enzyme|nr:GNAT family N-acetyltransferase [Bacteroidia bacterium]